MRPSRFAFTLIEFLLGLSIFSIIALVLYQTFSSGLAINQRSERVNRIYKEVRWSLDKIAQDLENMIPYDFRNSYPNELAVWGDQDKIFFLAPSVEGIKRVGFFLQPLEAGSVYKTIIGRHHKGKESIVAHYEERVSLNALVREEKSFLESLQDTPTENVLTDILCGHVIEKGLKFSYAYVEGQGENVTIVWKDEWGEWYIPSGVRIEMTFLNPENPKDTMSIRKDIFIPAGFLGQKDNE